MSVKKILVIDDNQVVLQTLSTKLRACGYEVLTAADGGTAVSSARLEKPDLILLDILFPPDVANGGGVAWDGFLILNWLRRMGAAGNVPVIVITGADQEIYEKKAADAGAIAFFKKPLDIALLISFIQELFQQEQTAPVQSV